MANVVVIMDGPSRFHLMMSVFDIDTSPRLLNFKFELEDGRKGSADVFIDGATQGNKAFEEWSLNGYFMPQGMETRMENMVPAKFFYSSRLRRGFISSVQHKTLIGRPVPDVIDLITWVWKS